MPIPLDTSTVVSLTLLNIKTTGVQRTTDSINIFTLHSGTTLDVITTYNTQQLNFQTGDNSIVLDSSKLSYAYQTLTSSERNVINITVSFTQNYQPGCSILLKFPSAFPRNLGIDLFCYSILTVPNKSPPEYTSTLLPCRVVNYYWIIINPIPSLKANNQWVISINNIYNPKSGSTLSSLLIYTQCSSNVFIERGEITPLFSLAPPGDILNVLNWQNTNYIAQNMANA